MDSDFRVGPMVERPPTARRAVFHFFEDVFDNELAAIGLDDSAVIPALAVGNDNVLAQQRVRHLMQRLGIDGVLQPRNLLGAERDFVVDDAFQMLPA